MMKKKIIFIISAIALMAWGCKPSNEFKLQGSIENGADKTMYIEEMSPEEHIFIDSIRLDKDGEFSFKYEMPYQSFYALHVTPTNYIILLPEGGEKIKVKACYDSLETTYEVQGSIGSELLWQLQEYSTYGGKRLAEVVAIDQQNRQTYANNEKAYAEAKKYTDSIYWDIYMEQSDFVKSFIHENKGSLATLIALYKPLGRDHALIDVKRDPSLIAYYDTVLMGLKTSLPGNPHTQHFDLSVKHLRGQIERYLQSQQNQQATITIGQ